MLLHDSDTGSNFRSFSIRVQTNISLLGSIRTDQSVDLGNINIIKTLDSILDLCLVGANICNKDKSIIVLNLLQSTFGSEWVLDDSVLIKKSEFGNSLSWVLWSTSKLESLWQVKGGRGLDLDDLLGGALQCSLLGSSSFFNISRNF
jgi:hypothetical protein